MGSNTWLGYAQVVHRLANNLWGQLEFGMPCIILFGGMVSR
ncbi:hypothetical protein ACFFYR_34665 [Paraburkholderia dipogonis]|nr:hypothetical protein [Paraburkholderia dipogonis]